MNNYRKIFTVLFTVVVMLSLALPVAAAQKNTTPVNVHIYKVGTYVGGNPDYSMAQKAVRGAYITQEGEKYSLTVETKYFKHMLIWGTMTQMHYRGHSSDENNAPVQTNGMVTIPLDRDLAQSILSNNETLLPDARVTSKAHFLVPIPSTRNVDFVIRKN